MLCTVIHEAGHCIAARISGARVKEFAIGMGPRLYSRELKNMKLSIKLFPIGGSCDIDDNAIKELPTIKKILIYTGGVLGNLLLSVIAAFLIFLALLSVREELENTGTPLLKTFFTFIWKAVPQMLSTVFHTVQIIIDTFKDSNLSANIGFINDAIVNNDAGFWSRLFYIGYINYILNMCLLFFNMIPFPGLDGSYVLLTIIESFFDKKISQKHIEKAMKIGIYILIAFSLIILGKEIVLLIIR